MREDILRKIIGLLETVIDKLHTLIKIQPVMNQQTPNSIRVYETAKSCLGKALAQNGELGCAEAVNHVFQLALGSSINESSSTIDLNNSLQDTSKYVEVAAPLAGDVIIAVTGTGNGSIGHGHAGIVGKFGILSNDSESGLFKEKWDLMSWDAYYGNKGGFKSHFYRVL